MVLPRALEPEVMDTEQEARDYDAMDHSQVNTRFCDDLLAVCDRLGQVLDVGTGTGLIPIELCRRVGNVEVHTIDLAGSMLALARRNVERAGLTTRVHLSVGDAKAIRWNAPALDAVISNSLVHHIPEPEGALSEMWRLVVRAGFSSCATLHGRRARAVRKSWSTRTRRCPTEWISRQGLGTSDSARYSRRR